MKYKDVLFFKCLLQLLTEQPKISVTNNMKQELVPTSCLNHLLVAWWGFFVCVLGGRLHLGFGLKCLELRENKMFCVEKGAGGKETVLAEATRRRLQHWSITGFVKALAGGFKIKIKKGCSGEPRMAQDIL